MHTIKHTGGGIPLASVQMGTKEFSCMEAACLSSLANYTRWRAGRCSDTDTWWQVWFQRWPRCLLVTASS